MVTLEETLHISQKVRVHEGHIIIACCLPETGQPSARSDYVLYANVGILLGQLCDKPHLDFTCSKCSTSYRLPADYIKAVFQTSLRPHNLWDNTANL